MSGENNSPVAAGPAEELKDAILEPKNEVAEPPIDEPEVGAASKASVTNQPESTPAPTRKSRKRRQSITPSPESIGIISTPVGPQQVSVPPGPPPPPIIIVSGSESDSSPASSSSDSEEDVKKASKLNHTSLFEAYARKLGHKPGATLKGSLRGTRGKKGPRLIAGFADYVHSLEARIHSLETQLDKDKPKDDDDKSDSSDDDGPTATSASGLGIKFFLYDNEVDPTGRFRMDRDFEPNTYRSSVDPWNFIRVLYRWKNEKPTETTQTNGDDEMPNPADIEVVGIRVDSISIAAFFRKTTHFYGTRFNLTELFKPFRSIIRNLAEFQANLVGLENRWGLVSPPIFKSLR